GAAWIAGGLVLVGFGVLFGMAAKPAFFLALADRASQRWPRLQTLLHDKLNDFLQGVSALRSPARFFKVAGLMLLTWVLNVGWYYVLMRNFFPEAPVLWALFSIGMVSAGVALPSS